MIFRAFTFIHDVVTGTSAPEITKTQTKYMKQWFSRHWASVNKGQSYLRYRKQMRGALQFPKLTLLKEFPVHGTGRGNSGGARQIPWLRIWTWVSKESMTASIHRQSTNRKELHRKRLQIFRECSWRIQHITGKYSVSNQKLPGMERNGKNRIHYEEKTQSTETNPEFTQILEWTEKNIKIIIMHSRYFKKPQRKDCAC